MASIRVICVEARLDYSLESTSKGKFSDLGTSFEGC
jgi:hypothetical protein